MNDLGVPLIKYSEQDNNGDGKIDSMKIQIEIKEDPATIRNVKVLGTFDYNLKKNL
jgi:hypothetical protein